MKREEHTTAEELYGIVKKRDRTIGQATVYRVVRLLCEAGLAREVDFGDGVMRYEHLYEHKHHDHLICRSCGRTVEVCDPVIEKTAGTTSPPSTDFNFWTTKCISMVSARVAGVNRFWASYDNLEYIKIGRFNMSRLALLHEWELAKKHNR